MAKSNFETIFALIVFVIILVVFISGGVFSAIFGAFNSEIFGRYGIWLAISFSVMIIFGLLGKIFEND